MTVTMTEKANLPFETLRFSSCERARAQTFIDRLESLLREGSAPTGFDTVADALTEPWAEPMNESDVETQMALSRLACGGSQYEVIVIVRGWSSPVAVQWSSLPRQIEVSHKTEHMSLAVSVND